MSTRLSTYLLIAVLFGFSGCGDRSETQTEKAEQLAAQAEQELHSQQYKEAERHFAESIELFAAEKKTAKVTELYSYLVTSQTEQGKLLPALQSLRTLRSLYKSVADRTSELNTTLEMARISLLLNKNSEAVTLLDEAYLSSQLFQLHPLSARTALMLGNAYAAVDRHTKAISYFSEAATQFLQLQDTAQAIEALIGALASSLQRNNKTAANQFLIQCENILRTTAVAHLAAESYTNLGFAFLNADEWELAKQSFEKSLHSSSSGVTPLLASAGLGEVFFYNFAFVDAQRWFVQAYKTAQSSSLPLVRAYLLIRIADCELRKHNVVLPQEQSIRVQQLYEHAHTAFARAGYHYGEAVVLHRLGLLKELSGDEYSAVTYYKRSFEKFLTLEPNPALVHQHIDIRKLITSPQRSFGSKQRTAEQYVSSSLVPLLLKQRKYSEALEYAERSHLLSLQRSMYTENIRFSDQKKEQLFAAVRSAFHTVNELQRASWYLVQSSDNDYATTVRQQLLQAHHAFTASVSAAVQSFPELRLLSPSRSIAEVKQNYLPPSVTALKYYFSDNEAWVFVIRKDEEVSAQQLSSSGMELKKKMNRLTALLTTDEGGYELKRLANELYTLLIQPVERFTAQRFLIIASEGLEKFPFHALVKNNQPLIAMTEVSYLPSLYLLTEKKPIPRFITNVVATGFSSDTRWGLEFELRDVRSFFKNAQVIVNQQATLQKLQTIRGEFLRIASHFTTTADGEHFFRLSDGTPSIVGVETPVSSFTSLAAFPFVYLTDLNATTNLISTEHKVLWLMNGTQSVVVNELPITPKLSRVFNEGMYAAYASTFSPYSAYRQGILQVSKQKDFSDKLSFASYFYYGL